MCDKKETKSGRVKTEVYYCEVLIYMRHGLILYKRKL